MGGMRGYSPEESRKHLAAALKGAFLIFVLGMFALGVVHVALELWACCNWAG